eukprot:GHVL01022163.1.p2 GENE.GHVL01022163.1~~GHVL01022163.1.p2  ORF type:complete len:133 (-),score=10.22 GHVL01022163.1:818-1216(-)
MSFMVSSLNFSLVNRRDLSNIKQGVILPKFLYKSGFIKPGGFNVAIANEKGCAIQLFAIGGFTADKGGSIASSNRVVKLGSCCACVLDLTSTNAPQVECAVHGVSAPGAISAGWGGGGGGAGVICLVHTVLY